MRRFLLRTLVAAVLCAGLVALRVKSHYPTLPNPLTFDLLLESAEAGRADPLIVAGRTNQGDFLSVRFTDADHVEFTYDSWGFPGIASQTISVEPGKPLRLNVVMPALDQVHGRLAAPSDRVSVSCNGKALLDVSAHYYVREPARIFLGENALGGTACGPRLHGRLIAADGRPLRGGPAELYSDRERLRDWLGHYPRQWVSLLLFSVVVAFYGPRLWSIGPVSRRAARLALRHRWFVGGALLACLAYAWLVTLGSFRFNHGEVFGSFYDYQAESFLQGRLDVPEDAIGGEAFEARGKLYGYFGPTPALLRLPFVMAGFAFGKLSRAFMLAYFAGSLLAAYLIFRCAQRAARPAEGTDATDDPPSPLAALVLVGSVGLGSTLFFLGSRGLIFHEAILGGIAFALWSCWCALRHLAEPARRWWSGALVCGVLSIHTRPPTGLFALTLLGTVTVIIAAREWRTNRRALPARWRRHLGIAVLCLAGVLSLNGLAWLKFHTFDAAPLRISRPYKDPGRLEHIDGKSFHLVNVPFNFDTYVLRPNFRLERGFPWIYLGTNTPRRDFPRAKIDLPDHTLAVPYAMPSLFALATLGCIGAAARFPRTRAAIGALWLAVLPMSLALFAAIATAQRYTGDFCPFLIAAGAFGLAAVENARAPGRRVARGLTALATMAAVAVTAAITLHYQGETLWGVPEQTRLDYQSLRHHVDAFFAPRAAPDR